MRLFIAIDAPDEIKDYFVGIQQRFDRDNAKISFVNKAQMHLTLKFLGEVQEDKVDKIKEILSMIKFKPFSVKYDKIGFFPDKNYIRVVWIGITPTEKIVEIQKQIESALSQMFKKEKDFSPHITFARIKFVRCKEGLINYLEKIKLENKYFEIREFKLVESILSSNGAMHRDLAIFSAT